MKANVGESWLINVKTRLQEVLHPFGIRLVLLVFNPYGLLETKQG
jgi:hypothetical protein